MWPMFWVAFNKQNNLNMGMATKYAKIRRKSGESVDYLESIQLFWISKLPVFYISCVYDFYTKYLTLTPTMVQVWFAETSSFTPKLKLLLKRRRVQILNKIKAKVMRQFQKKTSYLESEKNTGINGK